MGEFSFIGVAALVARAEAGMVDGVTQCAEDLVGKAQPLTRVDTGAERAGIHAEAAEVSGTSVSVKVTTGGESNAYDLYQHEGTRYMSGTHFLSIPLIENRSVYEEIMSRAIRGAF